MVVFPNAKINLGLQVTGKRSDGYHNLDTVFYPLPFSDILEINLSDRDQFDLSGIPVEGEPAENLCMKALRLMRDRVPVPPLHVHLHKMIPPGTGLGAGSSDAAFMLRAVNELCEIGFSKEDLLEMALELGSDCPFFIHSAPMSGSGRGEVLAPFEPLLKDWFVVVHMPGIHISTALAFSGIRPQSGRPTAKEVLRIYPVSEWSDHLGNDFERGVMEEHPEIAQLKKHLLQSGAEYASLSGTGSAVYGLFSREPELLPLPGHIRSLSGILS